MKGIDDPSRASLVACVAQMLNVDPSEIPAHTGASLNQWLAGRNFGLVPVESPESFKWPGRFLGLRRGYSTWAVFFGVPPGVIYDPVNGSYDKSDTSLEAAFVVAQHDPSRKTVVDGGFEGFGTVELVSLSAEAEGPMTVVSAAEALEGRGLRGDRYERGAGTFSDPNGRGYDLTLVEAEALGKMAEGGLEIPPAETRRNVVVRGIDLDGLIGKRFRVGEIECFGQRRCEPCAHLERLTRPGVLRGLVHRGGLRADILRSGEIRPGDRVEAIP